MAGETEDLLSIDGDVAQNEPKDTSIRGSIKAAIEEVKEDSGVQVRDDDRVQEKDKGSAPDKHKKSAPDKHDSDGDKPVQKADKDRRSDNSAKGGKTEEENTEGDKPTKQVSRPAGTDTKPPVGWTKEARSAWDTLSPDIQKSVLKREEEFSSGIKQYADKAKAFDELDQVIGPYKAQIAQFGVTPAQTISKMFEWYNLLGSNDPNLKLHGFKHLAASFGFDLNSLAPSRAEIVDDNNTSQFDPAHLNQIVGNAVRQHIQPIQQHMTTVAQQQEEESRRQAAATLADWAKDKPYYEDVKMQMHQLFVSGIVPEVNGMLDLDKAYDMAIRMNADIFEQFQQNEASKAAQIKAEKEAAEAAERKRVIESKRNLTVGLKPGSPMAVRAPATLMPGKNGSGKPVSARESIMSALREVRENQQL